VPDHNGDKSQEPTPHRRQKAREQGHVAKSQDLASALLLLLGVALLFLMGGAAVHALGSFTADQLGTVGSLTLDIDDTVALWHRVLAMLARYVLPIMGLMLVGAVLVNVLQIGLLFLPERVVPDITRLDPIKGLGRLFSVGSAMRLGFGIFKILVVAAVALVSLYGERETILGLTGMAAAEAAQYMVEILLWTSARIGVALLVLALLDYAFQKWKHEQDLKMTPQEVREEMKHLEGSPEVRQRRRQVQRQLAQQRLEKNGES
jgi:flagellar biosynthetic protein FlhB